MDLGCSLAVTELATCLQNTLSQDQSERKKAEVYLKSVEGQPSYSLCLLGIVLNESLPMPTRLAAAITFKNFVKGYWKADLGTMDRISEADRNSVRNQILGALLSVTGVLQPQLSEAIGAIWQEDFPDKWPNLIPELVERMVQLGADLNMVRGVLQTAHTLFKRYRHECAGNDLFREMKTVIGQFGAPMTELAKSLLALVIGEQRLTEGRPLVPVFQCLLLVCKIFLSLNCQDLPEFFEDNIADWMLIFRSLLQLDASVVQLVDSAAESLTGSEGSALVEQVKSQVCDITSLYASKYEAEFAPYLPGFVTDVWEMLVSTGGQSKFDMLIGNAIEFLSSVIARPQHRHLFESPEALQSLCEKVILPNMHFRALDEELFADNPEEYLRLDLEGSDIHTRRRSACNLVHVLCEAFEGPVVANFSTYIQHLLAEYANSPDGSAWPSKDAALLLVTSVAARGKTEKLGVTISTELVNIPTFFETHVLPELRNANVNNLPVIKADCMRYAITFRGLLPLNTLVELINLAPQLLTATAPVVHSYAAALIDKLLAMKRPGTLADPLITKDQIADPQLLIDRLLAILLIPDSTENVYVVRALMRACCCLQERCLASMNSLVSTLLPILVQVAKNPSKPNFNHFLFETICLCIRTTCAADPSSVLHFESAFFPVFQDILQNDISEFVPYVFQLLSVMLEQYPMSDTVTAVCKSQSMVNGSQSGNQGQSRTRPSPPYSALLPRLLIPTLWDQRGNVPALARLMQSYVLHDIEEVLSSNKLSAMLGVYQRLIQSSLHDTHAFALLGALVLAVPKPTLEPFLRQVFMVIFRRLQSSKTEKFMKAFVSFIARFVLVYSPNELIQLVDGIQAGLFARVLEKVLLPSTPKPLSLCSCPWRDSGQGRMPRASARVVSSGTRLVLA
ncbi:Exportin-2 [Clonorchis sinensis]|uniref:Exportin-2 n=1 Tax=Clonorchis sinensis TaxID=79923 RepID=A0A8T1N091_CLOSI|nr:Exportin-2 [Clonorchis sinensis]